MSMNWHYTRVQYTGSGITEYYCTRTHFCWQNQNQYNLKIFIVINNYFIDIRAQYSNKQSTL